MGNVNKGQLTKTRKPS